MNNSSHAASLSFVRSEEMLAQALEVIPLGAQTFSKSHTQWPKGAAPLFASQAEGARIIDVDGTEYIDFVNALAAITLGYCDPDVDDAVKKQIKNGVIMTLTSPLETEVAQMLVERIPCAQMVRFGKNGSDATSGAIRAARAWTGNDRIAVCGYHGWQDWYIGSTSRNRGVPEAVRSLTHTFPYNDLSALHNTLDQYPGEFAAIILEPMNIAWPKDGFLQGVRKLADQYGALLVFDETITGFRYARGGAQEYFGVTPDLATFGKGLANGYPISVVTGRADIMRIFEEIFFSFTMGGETLSLAAAKAAMKKADSADAYGHFQHLGTALLEGLHDLSVCYDCADWLIPAGHPSWPFLLVTDAPGGISLWNIKTLMIQELASRGFLCLGSHNLSLAHTMDDIRGLLAAYKDVFAIIAQAVREKNIGKYLHCSPLKPLFHVR